MKATFVRYKRQEFGINELGAAPVPIHDLNFPCAVCGSGAGQPCTKSCDDSSIPDNEVERVRCECGAAKLGHADYSPGHSSWCPVCA